MKQAVRLEPVERLAVRPEQVAPLEPAVRPEQVGQEARLEPVEKPAVRPEQVARLEPAPRVVHHEDQQTCVLSTCRRDVWL